MADGQITIKTLLDNSEVKKGIGSLKGLMSGGFGIMKAGAGLAVGALTGVSTAIGGLASAGVAYNAKMEGFNTSFKTMLGGSQEKAEQFTNSLKDMASKTPFAMETLAKSSQTMLAFGQSSDQVKKNLKMLGDVSLGDKQKMESLTLAFSQMSSTGKLTGQDLLQMINAGFNPLQEMSKTTGKSVAQLKDEMAKGAISAEDVTKAFESATSSGGQFFNGMEAQSKTFDGQISTLKDNFGGLVGAMSSGVFNSLATTVLPSLNGAVNELLTTFTNAPSTSEGFIAVADKLGEMIPQAIIKIQEGLPSLLEAGTTMLKSLIEGLTSNQEQMGESLTLLINTLIESITELFPLLAPLVVDLITFLITVIMDNLPTLLEAGYNLILSLISGFNEKIPEIMPKVTEFINKMLTVITNNLPKIINKGIEMLFSLIKGLASAMPNIIPQAINLVITLASTILDNVDKIVDMGIELIFGLIDGIVASIPTLVSKIPEIIFKMITAFVKLIGKFAEKGNELILKIRDGIDNKVGELIDKITGIGSDLIEGLWNGIKNMAGWIKGKIQEFGGNVLKSLKKFFGIHSPSKVMEKEVGKYLALGVGTGFVANAGRAYDLINGSIKKNNKKLKNHIDGGLNLAYSTGNLLTKIESLSQQNTIIKTELTLDGEKVAENTQKHLMRKERVQGYAY